MIMCQLRFGCPRVKVGHEMKYPSDGNDTTQVDIDKGVEVT